MILGTKFIVSKKFILLISVVLLVIIGVFYFPKKQKILQEQKRPNLILMSIDSLRADHLSLYGYSRQTTPNIDKLGRESIVFKNHISQSYVTAVSEMSVFTGMYPSSSGVLSFDTVLQKNILTLSEILKKYNYRNFAFGNTQEFDMHPAVKENFNRDFDIWDFTTGITMPLNQQKIFDSLRKDSKKPFFLWLPIGTAHAPYGESSRKFGDLNYEGIFKNQLLTFQNAGILMWVYNNTYYDPYTNNKIDLNEKDMQHVIDRYDDDIFATDEWVGKFFKQLEKEGLDKNTIIVIQSEHGEEFGEHGYIRHHDLFDNTVKTPFLIKDPNLDSKNLVIENQTQGIDILPTTLDLLKIPKAHQIQGSSLVPLIKGDSKEKINEYVFMERPFHRPMTSCNGANCNLYEKRRKDFVGLRPEAEKQLFEQLSKSDSFYIDQKDVAVRTVNWKLIYRKGASFEEKNSIWNMVTGSKFVRKIADYELYDLKLDPQEKKNVIEKYPQIANDLKKKINEFLKKVDNKNMKLEFKQAIQEYF